MLRNKTISLLSLFSLSSALSSCGQLIIHLTAAIDFTGIPINTLLTQNSSSTPTSMNFLLLSTNTGPIGTILTLTGADFSNAQTFNVGNTTGVILSYSSTSLIGLVMPGSTSGLVTVMNADANTISSSQSFIVTGTGVPLYQQGTKLLANNASSPAQQGFTVSISADGNTALVGGPYTSNYVGATWVFTKTGSSWTQQTTLIANDSSGSPSQGSSVSISADGNTALIGGWSDNSRKGATWVFTRSGSTWTQQGPKLLANDSSGASNQGSSVSISADGNTALVGGWLDNSYTGATWVFTRSGSTWTQQGSKLVGNDFYGPAMQGSSVSISADGNTALTGGYYDGYGTGATWVFTRSGSTWTQQGSKLVGNDAIDAAQQGRFVSLSGDGNTALIGGSTDNSGVGATWVFTRSGSTWTQQGSKILANDSSGYPSQGSSVSISADGNTALIGGSADNSGIGATWVFTRSGSTWTQQGSKILANDSSGLASQGFSASISADGNTALIGGFGDDNGVGATWVFTRSGSTWTQQGSKILSNDASGLELQGVSCSISANGNTALIGGSGDERGTGATWVFTRSGSTWTQQTKLVANDSSGHANQGSSVSISADGNTALIGGIYNNNSVGATWVFTKAGSTWTQQAKLIANDSSGASNQGSSVSISADGNTALIGGWSDNSNKGATWVFTRSGSTWTQQGPKLLANDSSGASNQGSSVSISADGYTALIGGRFDNSYTGATWVFTRSGSTWTQQGPKLVGNNPTGDAFQGSSVSISADGNTAIIGGPGDNYGLGVTWVFTRSGSTWTQQAKLLANNSSGGSYQGDSVSISADGNTALIGGMYDNQSVGATWVFTRSGSTWTQKGSKLLANDASGQPRQGNSVSISADGYTALVGGFYDSSGLGATWVFTP